MAIFGRKRAGEEKEAPNLPELPNLSDQPGDSGLNNAETEDYSYPMPEISKEIKQLPSFPDSEFGDSLSQEAVKSAITPVNKKQKVVAEPQFVLPATVKKPVSLNFKTTNKPIKKQVYNETTQPVYTPSSPIENAPLPITENYSPASLIQEKKISEPVYIRIDKFKFALESFQTIKEKINEVEKYLQEVKEQKKREDEELKEWENEIEAIKLRIEGIDNKIFSKV